MYEAGKAWLLWFARVPPEPHDPMGDVRTLRVFRAAPGYLRYLTAGWLVSQLGLLMGGAAGLAALLGGAALAGAPEWLSAGLIALAAIVFTVQAAVTFFWLRLTYELRWYKVTDRSLRIRAGIWSVHEMTVTFANVQNIGVTQGPLERLFGISNVEVTTAGGGSAHGKAEGGSNLHVAVFRGVDNPEEIRGLMLERLRQLRDAGLGDPDDGRDPRLQAPFADGPALLSALAALRDESRALRQAASALAVR
jgi:membrane protein YdbS with pleckstrin-like domain